MRCVMRPMLPGLVPGLEFVAVVQTEKKPAGAGFIRDGPCYSAILMLIACGPFLPSEAS